MPENEFEKQVKEMMESFSRVPSDVAWEKLSRRINTEKRRKRYFIFFLLAGLVATGFVVYNSTGKNVEKISQEVVGKNNVTAQPEHQLLIADSNKNRLSTIQPGQQITSIKQKEKIIISSGQKKPLQLSINKKENKTIVLQSAPKVKLNDADKADKNNVNESIQQQQIQQGHFDNSDDGSIEMKSEQDSSTKKDFAKNNLPVATENLLEDSMQSKNETEKKSTSTVTGKKNNEAKKKTSSDYTIPLWQWGVQAGYGRSTLLKGLSGNEKSYPASLNGPTAIPNNNAVTPSKIYTASDAFAVGFSLQRKLSKNSVIGAGLNFLHYSVKNGVNGLVNSGAVYMPNNLTGLSIYTVSRYYRPGSDSRYLNEYNFIELPVYFRQNIFHTKSKTLAYQAGFSVRQLLSQQALVYDAFNNVYYVDNNLMRKTQFQVTGGFNFSFNTGKKTAVFIGPDFSYSLSNLYNDKSKGNFHFIQYGIQAGMMFHKK
ncbi:MAG: hypothetical protein JST21_02410 [Bacteroidetes bacterium]|nr:hypothetical protein [Bacteroidota bacterium]